MNEGEMGVESYTDLGGLLDDILFGVSFYLAELFVISRRVGARMKGLKWGKKLPPF